ncbi:hypothetical protein IFR05_008656 [Cadophora sp. M221]|nr:hypothetical protein IFR05_008656 [Cadophora sp. M221]
MSATNCSNQNDNKRKGVSINDMLNSTETDFNEGSREPQSTNLLRRSSISQGQRFEHPCQESRPISAIQQEYRAPVAAMLVKHCRQLPPSRVPADIPKCLFVPQNEPGPDIKKERRDSGVKVESSESEEECIGPIAKNAKRKQSDSQSPKAETPKRKKGVAYPVKGSKSMGKSQRLRRKFCMSAEESERFRAQQAEYLHDDNANIISEIPRFTRSQNKLLKGEVMTKPTPAKLSTGLTTASIDQLFEENDSDNDSYESDFSRRSEPEYRCPSQSQGPEPVVKVGKLSKKISSCGKTVGCYKKPSKQANRVRQHRRHKISSKSSDESVENPQSEVQTGIL